MIDVAVHKAVVVINNGATAYGFPHVYSAVAFIERQVPKDKGLRTVIDALSDEGVEPGVIGPDNYKIMSADDYIDAYGEDEGDESIDTLEVGE